MIDEKTLEKVTTNWLRASKELKFKIEIPYNILIEGKKKKIFAYLPEYGSKKGMIVDFVTKPDFLIDNEITKWAKYNDYYFSYINIEVYLVYNSQNFMESLNDWGCYSQHIPKQIHG